MSIPPPIPPQLTPENFQQLNTARVAMKKIRRAIFSAKLEGYTITIFGFASLLFSIGSIPDMIAAAVLSAVGIVELTGASKLARLDPKALRILAVNQLTLGVLILLYALWKIYLELATADASLAGLSPSDAKAMQQIGVDVGDLTNMSHEIMLIVYSGMVVAALVEAGMALYYYSRRPYLDQFIAQTPEWIVSMQKSGVEI